MADYSKYYRAYMYMQELLQNDFTYNYINAGLKDGDKGEDSLVGKTNEKVIDMEWVEAIEETLPYIQKAIDEQRRFINQIENVVRIELARKTGPESVKHLSQHTNFIAKVEGDMVTPNKILVTEQEESFAIYENRVLMTLIRRALLFVADKYTKMKDVPDDSYNEFTVERTLNLNEEKTGFQFKYSREAHETLADDLDALDVNELSDFDRIRKIRNTLNSFLNTPLMMAIAKEPEVRPPLTQTNLLKKNPNYKKAVELWNFLDSYKKSGFEIVGEKFDGVMSEQIQQDVYFTMGFEHFMMSIATNPGLRRLLQEKYEEENARLAEEAARPEKTRESVLKAQLDAVRKEEMEIRLKEIREREKKILDLTNEIKNLKNQLAEKERIILSLKGKISMLEDQVNELKAELQETKLKLLEAEKRIKELEEENEQLKAKVAELEAHIEELNATIAELNKQIDVLKDRVQVLLQENAAQKAKIEEQEQIIAEQTEKINGLEAQVAEQLATIAALTENIAKCEEKIAEDERQISNLTERNNQLTDTLQTERTQAKEREAQMKADFEAKTEEAAQAHAAEIKSMQKTIDDADAAHAQTVAKMNADFADKTNAAEQKRIQDLASQQQEFEKQINTIKKNNTAAAAAVDAKHATEIKKVQKSVDKRVAAVEKDAERRLNEKVKEVQKSAKNDIRTAKDALRAAKTSADLIIRDYNYGCMSVITAYAQQAADAGVADLTGALVDASRRVKAVAVTKSNKGVSLCTYTNKGFSEVKLYKKSTSLDIALADVSEELAGISTKPVCVTYSGVGKSVAESFAAQAKSAGADRVTISENPSLNSNGMVAIYFCKE